MTCWKRHKCQCMRGVKYSAHCWRQTRGCLLIDVWNAVLPCHQGCDTYLTPNIWDCLWKQPPPKLPVSCSISLTRQALTLHITDSSTPSKGFCQWENAKQKIGVQQVAFPIGAVLSHQILKGISGITSSLPVFVLPNKFKDAFSFTTYCSGLFCLCILLSWTHLRAALYHG